MNKNIDWKKTIISVLIGGPIAIALIIISPEFSRLGVVFVFELFAFGALMLVNELLYPSVNFFEKIIEDGNVALAILITGLVVIPLLAS